MKFFDKSKKMATKAVKATDNVIGAFVDPVLHLTHPKFPNKDSSHGRPRHRAKSDTPPSQMDLFCDGGSETAILQQIEKVQENDEITNLNIYDLLLIRQDQQSLRDRVIQLIVQTALDLPIQGTKLPPRIETETDNHHTNNESIVAERVWEMVTFCDNIMSLEGYQHYENHVQKFRHDLKLALKKAHKHVPVQFTSQVHVKANVMEAIYLLHEIQNDTAIKSVSIPVVTKEADIPQRLQQCFDPETLQWNDDKPPMVINIDYGDGKRQQHKKPNNPHATTNNNDDNNNNTQMEAEIGQRPQRLSFLGRRPTRVLRDCIRALERLLGDTSEALSVDQVEEEQEEE